PWQKNTIVRTRSRQRSDQAECELLPSTILLKSSQAGAGGVPSSQLTAVPVQLERAARFSRGPLSPPEAIAHDVVGRPAHGDDFWRAVAVEVAPAQVLCGDVAVEDGTAPDSFRAVEVVHRNPMVLATVAGEDLIVAVAVHIAQPQRVAVVERIVQHGAAAASL